MQNDTLKPLILISEQTEIPKIVWRLVCKGIYEFCEEGKKWLFNNENYRSFQQEIGKPWVELLLSKLRYLSFHNSIEPSALEDDLEVAGQKNNILDICTLP